MKHLGLIPFLLFITTCLCSCIQGHTEKHHEGDTIPMKYARNLILIQHGDYVEAILRNPWDTTKVLNRYEIREAKKRIAVTTSVHCALMQELGVVQNIVGVCDLQYIALPYIQKGVEKGTITDLGNATEPNPERTIDLAPDAFFVSPFEHSGGYGKLDQTNIPIIECADYMEVSPLARAEWIKFYSRLMGVPERGDSIFHDVERKYLALKKEAATAKTHPLLLVEQPYQGIWYVPAGHSTMGILYRDAGAHYIFSDRTESGSLPLSPEAVMEQGMQADIWLLKYNCTTPLTLAQLSADQKIYTRFRAFQEGNVYGCNTSNSAFYEETPFHPERLLADLAKLFHPELTIHPEHRYYLKLHEK